MKEAFAIAIDGPVAAGKGTIADILAKRLNGFHLNTGAMYRALALYCLDNDINIYNNANVITALKAIVISFKDGRILVNGQDVTEKIKERKITQNVSIVAAIADVRREMVTRQRKIGMEKIKKGQIVLVDARDAATKIFPDARLKVFLTASLEVRAKRRYQQNPTTSFSQILKDTKERDYKDTHRAVDPLVSNPQMYGYIIIDNSNFSEVETANTILEKLKL